MNINYFEKDVLQRTNFWLSGEFSEKLKAKICPELSSFILG